MPTDGAVKTRAAFVDATRDAASLEDQLAPVPPPSTAPLRKSHLVSPIHCTHYRLYLAYFSQPTTLSSMTPSRRNTIPPMLVEIIPTILSMCLTTIIFHACGGYLHFLIAGVLSILANCVLGFVVGILEEDAGEDVDDAGSHSDSDTAGASLVLFGGPRNATATQRATSLPTFAGRFSNLFTFTGNTLLASPIRSLPEAASFLRPRLWATNLPKRLFVGAVRVLRLRLYVGEIAGDRLSRITQSRLVVWLAARPSVFAKFTGGLFVALFMGQAVLRSRIVQVRYHRHYTRKGGCRLSLIFPSVRLFS